MDCPRILSNAILPLVGELETNGSPIDHLKNMDKVSAGGEVLEGQNNEGVASDFPEGGSLQVRLWLMHTIWRPECSCFFFRTTFWKLFEKKTFHLMAVFTILQC